MSHDFGRHTLPLCSFRPESSFRPEGSFGPKDGSGSTETGDSEPRVGVGVDDRVLDLTSAAEIVVPEHAHLFADGTLDAFFASGYETWNEIRHALHEWLGTGTSEDGAHEEVVSRYLVPTEHVTLGMPFSVADYVDFYASEEHATNLGKMMRPNEDALKPNWKHLPVGYHGRSGTVVPSGTPVVRPSGQRRSPDGEIVFGPSIRLDIEAELGFVVGSPSTMGEPVPLADFDRHVFGVCLLNDWSARDIQGWEAVPLGPFLGKSFATSISGWVIPLAALSEARVHPPERTTELLPYLDDATAEPWGLDLDLEISINGTVVSKPPFARMYWTGAQMLAHTTVNGASLRTGDLFASGTISGPSPDRRGSLIELSWNGAEPFALDDGTTRSFLEDGDEVVIRGWGAGPSGERLWLGEVGGIISPSV